MTEPTTPHTAKPYEWVGQIQPSSAERILSTLKLVSVVVILVALAGVSAYWWGRIDGVQSQADKIKSLQDLVAQRQATVVQKVYEDRIVYKDRIETIEVPKIIEKKVYQNICLDDEGVSAFNQFTKP